MSRPGGWMLDHATLATIDAAGGAFERGDSACVGEAGTDADGGARVRKSIHRCDGLGGSDGPEFPQARLRILGRRPDVSGARDGYGTGKVDVAQRFSAGR